MPKVELMEFDKVKRKFTLLAKIDLISIPSAGDKLIHMVELEEFIFTVYDVHYVNTNSLVKVNVIRLSNLQDYHSSGFSDITYYG
jgi:hypothetical protein